MIDIASLEEYEYCKSRGFEPLADMRFRLPHALRIEIQRAAFGTDEDFYRYCWRVFPHYCEETGAPLYEYNAKFISHILSRGAHPDMRYDPRNINILSYQMHNFWEFGKRQRMRIYDRNLARIEMLKNEYQIK